MNYIDRAVKLSTMKPFEGHSDPDLSGGESSSIWDRLCHVIHLNQMAALGQVGHLTPIGMDETSVIR